MPLMAFCLFLLVMASPAAAQASPCPLQQNTATLIPGEVFGVAFCAVEATDYLVRIDGVRQPWAGMLTKTGPPSAIGEVLFETPKVLPAPFATGPHTLTVSLVRADATETAAIELSIAVIAPGDQQTSTPTPLSCALTGTSPNFSIACVPPPVTTLPSEPAACVSVPLVVKVWAWPASSGLKPSLGFDSTPEWASWSIVRTPKMALTVVDSRGCKATVTR